MKSSLLLVWRWVKWPLIVLAVAYFALVAYRIVVLTGEQETQEDVAAIHADKLEWSDINGELPPQPDEAENNRTLAGVDSNQNGIRDDVEIAIYAKYKDQIRVGVAMLQYAKALQKEFTHVYNSETLVAVQQEQSRGFSCSYGHEEEVVDLVFNTEARIQYAEDVREKYGVSYSLPNGEDCDLDF